MSVLIVIPARFASSRYPGKPLVALRGASGLTKSLIQRSWEAACQVTGDTHIVIATDDDRIAAASRAFGAEVIMTSDQWHNGTERCAEADHLLKGDHDCVVNLQGDAPLTPPWFIEDLVAGLRAAPQASLATPVLRCDGQMLADLKADRQAGRVGGTTAVFDQQGHALYFSKEVIPFTTHPYPAGDPSPVFHHVGVYAYRPAALADYATWPPGVIEQLEGLEQLRFLEQGHMVKCVEVDARGRSFWELNNPEDVPRLEAMMADMGME
ncbi:3-deoxy-manno-octulosonate cytidylyltransferase [Actibacterium sp. 188UL27-1]|uniref:3-deoxy-manno-octulosonate cytidylyltransferase n=1 Tax=Actibacterium sp. 188UL27-1 TaxID=2786961 RepID=UPI00195AD8D9|nr:manno-octulosonate cytidylyltransferase [Actibacterium sp. 188UL27-1]MBM7067142.1 3-deoxy-manno-octulosonate cytidylyltransferase [Actibacterium sp. 188UL27-1]